VSASIACALHRNYVIADGDRSKSLGRSARDRITKIVAHRTDATSATTENVKATRQRPSHAVVTHCGDMPHSGAKNAA
jgi:hypothetical protein